LQSGSVCLFLWSLTSCIAHPSLVHSWRRCNTAQKKKQFCTVEEEATQRKSAKYFGLLKILIDQEEQELMEKSWRNWSTFVCVWSDIFSFYKSSTNVWNKVKLLNKLLLGKWCQQQGSSASFEMHLWHSTWLGTVRGQLLVLHDPGRSDDDVCPLALAQCSWSRCLAIPGAAIGLSLVDYLWLMRRISVSLCRTQPGKHSDDDLLS
jgi:hypothetical protein